MMGRDLSIEEEQDFKVQITLTEKTLRQSWNALAQELEEDGLDIDDMVQMRDEAHLAVKTLERFERQVFAITGHNFPILSNEDFFPHEWNVLAHAQFFINQWTDIITTYVEAIARQKTFSRIERRADIIEETLIQARRVGKGIGTGLAIGTPIIIALLGIIVINKILR